MITDRTYISYDEAMANPKYRHTHLEQCIYLVADAERTLHRRKKELERAEQLAEQRETNNE